jgi:hypothetical protein
MRATFARLAARWASMPPGKVAIQPTFVLPLAPTAHNQPAARCSTERPSLDPFPWHPTAGFTRLQRCFRFVIPRLVCEPHGPGQRQHHPVLAVE